MFLWKKKGSSPIGYEGFVQTSNGQGEAKLNSYYNNCVTHIYQPVICKLVTFVYLLLIVIIVSHGSVSKPCTPGEHQNSW